MPYKQALKLYYQANQAYQNQDHQKAISIFKKALQLAPHIPEISHNLAICYADIGNVSKAFQYYSRAINLAPNLFLAYYNRGNLHLTLADYQSAVDDFQKSVEINQKFFEGWLNLGIAQSKLEMLEDANRSFITALEIKKHPEAYNNCATNLMKLHQDQEALELLQEAYHHYPHHPLIHLNLLRTAQNTCSFHLINQLEKDRQTDPALQTTHINNQGDDPFNSLIRTMDMKKNLEVARFSSNSNIPCEDIFHHPQPSSKKRLKIGYLSFDFRNHVIGHHIFSVFKHHDRDKVEVFAYALHPGDGSNFSRFIRQHADHYIDLSYIPNHTAAKTINQDQIDILIDLGGHTAGNRIDILKYRPAPIIISYLGFPGSTGADYIDYIITDKVLTPPSYQPYYSEKFLYLPHGYQISSYQELPPAPPTQKLDHGLPIKYLVFSCFNNAYKIDEEIVQTWFDILRQVDQSLLWLNDIHDAAKKNLKAYAKDVGISPTRLIFAPRTSLTQHLERLRHVDIALDTPRYNGGATTSNALYAGVPVITKTGSHYASRMATSLLTHLGLSELATNSLDAYKQLAITLATHPHKLASLKNKLKNNIQKAPLFNSQKMTQSLENAYFQAFQSLL